MKLWNLKDREEYQCFGWSRLGKKTGEEWKLYHKDTRFEMINKIEFVQEMGRKLCLVVKNYRGYDTYAIPIDREEKTWKEVLSIIEDVLDERFLNNNGSMEGIELYLKIKMFDLGKCEVEA